MILLISCFSYSDRNISSLSTNNFEVEVKKELSEPHLKSTNKQHVTVSKTVKDTNK